MRNTKPWIECLETRALPASLLPIAAAPILIVPAGEADATQVSSTDLQAGEGATSVQVSETQAPEVPAVRDQQAPELAVAEDGQTSYVPVATGSSQPSPVIGDGPAASNGSEDGAHTAPSQSIDDAPTVEDSPPPVVSRPTPAPPPPPPATSEPPSEGEGSASPPTTVDSPGEGESGVPPPVHQPPAHPPTDTGSGSGQGSVSQPSETGQPSQPAEPTTSSGNATGPAESTVSRPDAAPAAPSRLDSSASFLPPDSARATTPNAPVAFAAAFSEAAATSRPFAETSATPASAGAAIDHRVPMGSDGIVLGIPGPADVAATSAPPGDAAPSAQAAPLGVPRLAGVLMPSASLASSEPLLALQQIVEEAEGWGGAALGSVTTLLTSPWIASAAVATVVVEMCRRRARRQERVTRGALDVPEITGPSRLS